MMDYKKYSLEKLQEWVHDALSSGEASPHEIYSVIREAAQEDYQFYKDHSARAFGLLELLSGHRPVADDEELYRAALVEKEYYDHNVKYADPGMRPWGHSDIEYQIANRKKSLTCDKDDPSPECKGAWNDFWEEHYYPEEHSKHYYDYTRNDPNRKNPFDKVKKWILPVDESQNAETGEYESFVTFPKDLLEAANLKEGDSVEWVDKGDGSYLLKKVEQPSWVRGNELAKVKTYNEMIEDGWELTDDGFWIKEN